MSVNKKNKNGEGLTGAKLLIALREYPQYEGMTDYGIKKSLGKNGKIALVSDLRKEYHKLKGIEATKPIKTSRCWAGYEPVPGKKPYSKGSCKKSQ